MMRRFRWTAVLLLVACTATKPASPPESASPPRNNVTRRAADEPNVVVVTFTGLMCHLIGAHSPRTVVVQDVIGNKKHVVSLKLPSSVDAAAVKGVFPQADCSDGCVVHGLEQVGLRVTGEGPIQSTLVPSPLFSDEVPHLGEFIDGLKDEIFDEVPRKDGVVSAYFVLGSGDLDEGDAFGCRARYDDPGAPNAPFRKFSKSSTFRQQFTSGATLEVIMPPPPGHQPQWKAIPLGSGTIQLAIDNEGPDGPHVELLEQLAKLTKKHIPRVVKEPNCMEMHGGTPGCANTQWP